MAIRSRAAVTSAGEKHGSTYPCGVKPESMPSISAWLR